MVGRNVERGAWRWGQILAGMFLAIWWQTGRRLLDSTAVGASPVLRILAGWVGLAVAIVLPRVPSWVRNILGGFAALHVALGYWSSYAASKGIAAESVIPSVAYGEEPAGA